MPRPLPKPFPYRGGIRAQITNPRTKKRPHKDFLVGEEAKANAWIQSMYEMFSLERSGRLGGPANCTLVQLLTEYARVHYTRLTEGAVQDVNRVNRWREAVGLPRLTLEKVGNIYRIDEDCSKDYSQRKTEAEIAYLESLKDGQEELFQVMRNLGTKLCIDITRNDIAEYIDALAACGNAPGNIANQIAVLRGAMNKAIKDWGWEGFSNPATSQTPGKSKSLGAVLESDVLKELVEIVYDSQHKQTGPAVEFAFCTLLRKGALLGLRWRDIDLEAKFCLVKVKKSKLRGEEITQIPLSSRAIEILKSLPGFSKRNPSSRVFDGLTETILDNAFEKARAKVGRTDWRFHDLRHFGATYLARKNINAHHLKRMLGHKTIHMAVRYVQLNASDVSQFLESNVEVDICKPQLPQQSSLAKGFSNKLTSSESLGYAAQHLSMGGVFVRPTYL